MKFNPENKRKSFFAWDVCDSKSFSVSPAFAFFPILIIIAVVSLLGTGAYLYKVKVESGEEQGEIENFPARGGSPMATISNDSNSNENASLSQGSESASGGENENQNDNVGADLVPAQENGVSSFFDRDSAYLTSSDFKDLDKISYLSDTISNDELEDSKISLVGESGDFVDNLHLGETLKIQGGEGIDTEVLNNEVVVSGEDASVDNKGVAKFDSSKFEVTSGKVDILDIYVRNTGDSIDGDLVLNGNFNANGNVVVRDVLTGNKNLMISGIDNDGYYTQTGTDANTFTGVTTFERNVGVGTTNPDSNIQVSSEESARLRVSVNENNLTDRRALLESVVYQGPGTVDNVFVNMGAYGSSFSGTSFGLPLAGMARVGGYADLMVVGNVSTTGALAFGVNNAEAVRISNNGRVGIGTTAPQAMLDIQKGNADIYLTSNIAGETPLTIRADNDLPFDSINPYIRTGGGGSLDLESSNQSGVYGKIFMNMNKTGHIMLAGGGGNVGIGISGSSTNPSAKLHVVGTTLFQNASNAVNSYQFNNATGTSVMSVDTTNGNVGIGTTNPGAQLEVRAANSDTVTDLLYLQQYNAAGSDRSLFKVKADAANNLVTLTSSGTNNGGFAFNNSGSSETVRITNSGNVGIGSTNPTALLHVTGTALFQNSANAVNSYQFNNLSGTSVMSVDTSNGRVGIGNTNPAYKLEITGSLKVNPNPVYNDSLVFNESYGSPTLSINSTGSDNAKTFQFLRGGSLDWAMGMAGDYTTNLYFMAGGTGTGNVKMALTSGGNIGIGTNGPDRRLDVLDASNPQLRLTHTDGSVYTDLQTTSAGNLYINPSGGNVGIGTTSPSTALDILGGVRNSFRINESTASGKYLSIWQGSTGVVIDPIGTDVIRLGYDSPASIYFGNGTSILQGSGKIGIATLNPSLGKIHVKATSGSNGGITLQSSNDESIMQMTYDSASDRFGIGTTFGSSGDYKDLSIGSGSSSTKLLLQLAGGNVGIGTTTPGSKLTVAGTTLFQNSANAVNSYQFNNATGTSVMSVDTTNGRVGIGTTAPDYNLTVYGTAIVRGGMSIKNPSGTSKDSTILNIASNTTSTGNLITFYGGTSNGDTMHIATSYWSSDGPLALGTYTNPDTLTMIPSGNIGIGTTNPAYKLDVSGTGRFTGALTVGGSLTLTGDLLPSANDTYSLGSDSMRWANAWLGAETIHVGTADADEGEIGYDTTNNVMTMQSNGNLALQASSGNVGIGTTSPTAKLDISGSGTGTNMLKLYNSSATTAGDWRFIIGDPGNYDGVLKLGRGNFGNDFDMALGSTGKLMTQRGIALMGNSNLSANENSNTGIYTNSGDHLGVSGLNYITFNTTGSMSERMRLTSGGNFGVGTTNPTALLHVAGTTLFKNSADAVNSYQFTNAAGTSVLSVDTTNGRIGIGTTAPGTKLEVNSGSSGVSGLMFTQLNSGSGVGVGGGKVLSLDAGGNVILVTDQTGSGTALPSGSTGATLYHNGTNWVSSTNLFHNGGNVGIGTTSPGANLNIEGATPSFLIKGTGQPVLDIQTTSSGTNASRLRMKAGSSWWGYTVEPDDSAGSPNAFNFYDYSANQYRMVIKNTSGNVGIGNINPTALLHVSGTTLFQNSANAVNSYQFNNSTGTSVMSVDTTNSRVGVGTTAPSSKLHIVGNDSIPDNTITISVPSSSNYGPTFNFDGTGAGGHAWSMASTGTLNAGGAGSLRFYDLTAGATRMLINPSGNIGIGTTNPTYQLTMGTGGGYYNQGTGAWTNGSDVRYKENITDMSKYGLGTIEALHPVSYTIKQSGISQIGFIAQEVQGVVPELVSENGGYLGLNYGGFTPILVKAIQEQQQTIGDLNGKWIMENGESEIGLLKSRVEELENFQFSIFNSQSISNDSNSNGNINENQNDNTSESSDMSDSSYTSNSNLNSNDNVETQIETKLALLGISDLGESLTGFLREVWFSAKVTFEKTVAFMSEVTFGGKVKFEKGIELGKDSAGQVVVLKGEKQVEVLFEEGYEKEPIVTVTPTEFLDGSFKAFAVKNENSELFEKFEIKLEKEQTENVKFNWHVFQSSSDSEVGQGSDESLNKNINLNSNLNLNSNENLNSNSNEISDTLGAGDNNSNENSEIE